jgi:hypothetical protein
MQLPFQKASQEAIDKVMVSVTLIRLDDWRSFRLFGDIPLEAVDYGPSFLQVHCCIFPCWGQLYSPVARNEPGIAAHYEDEVVESPFASNESGSVAHEALESMHIPTMQAEMIMTFQCTLPSPGAPTEPTWLQKFRQHTPAGAVWSGKDYDEIAQVKTFPFHLDSLSFEMLDSDESGDGFVGEPQEFLLLLEGLDWQ